MTTSTLPPPPSRPTGKGPFGQVGASPTGSVRGSIGPLAPTPAVVHLPSIVIGALVGMFLAALLRLLGA